MIRSILCVLFLVFGSVVAQDSFSMEKLNNEVKDPFSYSKQDLATEKVSPVFLVFRIIGSLALLTALIFGVVWGVRKSGVLEPVALNTETTLELLDELSTGSGNSVVLVRFDEKVLVLGQTGSSMAVLETIEGDSATRLIARSAGGKSVGTFKANLNKYVMNLQKGSRRG